jgi:DNA repair exonuclease SbcCD nuclease subunit
MWNQAFCYITDLHLTEKRPRFRKDVDYFGSQLNVLKQVTAACKERKVSTIICGGDIMNVYNEFSWRMVNEIRDVFKGFSVYTIIGNHDIPGGNLDRLDWSTVGLLLDIEAFQRLTTGSWPVFRCPITGHDNVLFRAGDWGSETCQQLETNTLPKIGNSKAITILVAHSSIGPKKTRYCMGVEEIDPPYDYVLLGDIHDGHPTYVSPSGCRIINPGSLGISSQKDADRPPRCVFIWPYERREEYIPLSFKEDQGFDKKRIKEFKTIKAAKFTRALAQAQAKKKGLSGGIQERPRRGPQRCPVC